MGRPALFADQLVVELQVQALEEAGAGRYHAAFEAVRNGKIQSGEKYGRWVFRETAGPPGAVF